jgi:Tfp pilus assembly protein PilF
MGELSWERRQLSLAKANDPSRLTVSDTSLYNPAMPIRLGRRVVIPLLAAALIAAMYAAGSWSNRFVYDDHEVIENQFPIRHLNDLGRVFAEPHYLNFPYYRPITRTTFALQQMSAWSRTPWAYHLVNAMLAGVAVLAVYALLRRPAFRLSWIGAIVAASWFGLHPAVSECVYPAASGRETLLPAILIILTTWAYLGRGWNWFICAMVLFVCSLLSKEQAAVLPAIFLLIDILGLGKKPHGIGAWAGKYLSIIAIFAIYFFVRHLIFHQQTLHFTLWEHPLDPLKSMLYGIQTAVAPFMALHYEPPFESWFDARLSAVSCAVLLLVMVVGAQSKHSIRHAGVFWTAWFVLLQLPTAHIVEQEAGYSERYVALAILAVPAMVMILIDAARPSKVRTAAVTAVAAWMIVAVWISFWRGSYYTDDASFSIQWENTNPNAAGAHDGVGFVAQQRKEYTTAIDEYEKSLAIEPNDATARNNLANVLSAVGDFEGASAQYEWLLNHNSAGADPVAVMTNYALLLGQEAVRRNDPKMRDTAHGLLDEVVEMRPDYARAHYILGIWNLAFGSREAAIRQFKIALQLHPDSPDVEARLRQAESSPTTSGVSVPSTRP